MTGPELAAMKKVKKSREEEKSMFQASRISSKVIQIGSAGG